MTDAVSPLEKSPDAVLLCVDDDRWFLDVTKRLLEKRGYYVLTAGDGHEAIEVFRGNRVDLVVVDYEMPVMKGHELAANIKGLNPNVPIILQSGSPELPESVTAAVDAFVPKGNDIYLLLSAIAALIARQRSHGGHNPASR